jgi:hypothetical protein
MIRTILVFVPDHLPVFKIRDAPDIRPDNPAFFDIRYPPGYRIALPDIRPDIRQGRITGYPANV